jgi:hypothetical protein
MQSQRETKILTYLFLIRRQVAPSTLRAVRVPTGTFRFYYKKKKDRHCTYSVTMRRVRVLFIPPRLS